MSGYLLEDHIWGMRYRHLVGGTESLVGGARNLVGGARTSSGWGPVAVTHSAVCSVPHSKVSSLQ